jgi:hypothetical protein
MIVTILMYACSITYSTKFSGELLKGKNSKKAFIDSTKKSAWVTLDLSVITLIAGIFIFLLGNSYISGCGIILFFGALLNLAIQFIVNGSGLYFLSTSHYGLNNRGLITSKFVNKAKEAEKAEEVKEEETKEEVKEEIIPEVKEEEKTEPEKIETIPEDTGISFNPIPKTNENEPNVLWM